MDHLGLKVVFHVITTQHTPFFVRSIAQALCSQVPAR